MSRLEDVEENSPYSPFLKRPGMTELPPDVKFHHLFGFKGKSNLAGALSDEAVLLSSMLDYKMQESATKVYGFDDDHIDILERPEVIERINQLLNLVPDSRSKGN